MNGFCTIVFKFVVAVIVSLFRWVQDRGAMTGEVVRAIMVKKKIKCITIFCTGQEITIPSEMTSPERELSIIRAE